MLQGPDFLQQPFAGPRHKLAGFQKDRLHPIVRAPQFPQVFRTRLRTERTKRGIFSLKFLSQDRCEFWNRIVDAAACVFHRRLRDAHLWCARGMDGCRLSLFDQS